MNVSKIIGIVALLLAVPAMAGESEMKAQWDAMPDKPACPDADGKPCKLHKCQGETFKVMFDPETYRMTVKGMGLTAYITIHQPTRKFRESLDGWGTNRASVSAALEGACGRIIDMAKEPSVEELQKGMREFFEKL